MAGRYRRRHCTAAVISRLTSLFCPTPYNNLGVNGARLYEMRWTTTATDSVTEDNYFFDIVLRNISPPPLPNFGGTTVVEQAAMLQPDIILLWIGNNDILHTVLDGCGVNGSGFVSKTDPPTSEVAFQSEYTNLLNDLKAVTDNIVIATIPSYLPYGYALDSIFVSDRLSVFDPQTFAPILYDYDAEINLPIPLLPEEADAKHLTLNGAIAYLEEGKGIPDQDTLETVMGYSTEEAAAMIAAMQTAEITAPDPPVPLEGNFTITQAEEIEAKAIVDGYNLILSSLSGSLDVPLVDITKSWWREYPLDEDLPAFGGYSGAFVLQDRDNTIFSLDGVHLNNLGHALAANSFIEVLNQNYGLGIQPLNPDDYKGQYSEAELESASIKAIKSVYDAYVPQNP